MQGLRVFLGGPIQYILHDEGLVNSANRKLIKMLVDVLENDDIQVFSAHITEEFGMRVPEKREICARDFNWMKLCNVFCLLLLPDENGTIRSDGSCIELGWAFYAGKPIVVLTDTERVQQTSALLQGVILEADATVVAIDEIMANPKLLCRIVKNAVNNKCN